MSLTFKQCKKEKLDHFFYLGIGYPVDKSKEKENGRLVVLKFDVVGSKRLYYNDEELPQDLEGFLKLESKKCYKTREEAEKCRSQTS